MDFSIHSPDDFIRVNILGMFHLQETVRAYWAGLKGLAKTGFRFLRVSTAEGYGSLEQQDPAFLAMN